MGKIHTGGCQCGALRYKISGDPLVLYVCHCSECQTQSGSAFGMSLAVRGDDFQLTSGIPMIWRRSSESGNAVDCAFCANCGTRIFHKPERSPGTVNIKPGTLDDTRWLDPGGHLWTDSAQRWVNLDDERIHASAQPTDFKPIRACWQRKYQA